MILLIVLIVLAAAVGLLGVLFEVAWWVASVGFIVFAAIAAALYGAFRRKEGS